MKILKIGNERKDNLMRMFKHFILLVKNGRTEFVTENGKQTVKYLTSSYTYPVKYFVYK